jgi:hypothetical protein
VNEDEPSQIFEPELSEFYDKYLQAFRGKLVQAPELTHVGDMVAKAQTTRRYFILQPETGKFDPGSEAAIKY